MVLLHLSPIVSRNARQGFGGFFSRSPLFSSSSSSSSFFQRAISPLRIYDYDAVDIDAQLPSRSRIAVYLDLDNIRPPRSVDLGTFLTLLMQPLETALSSRGTICRILFANPITTAAVEGIPDGWVMTTSWQANQAVDILIRSAIHEFVSYNGKDSCLVLISNDQGFAKDLQYARGCGCAVILINQLAASPSGSHKALQMWRRTKLPEAADLTLLFKRESFTDLYLSPYGSYRELYHRDSRTHLVMGDSPEHRQYYQPVLSSIFGEQSNLRVLVLWDLDNFARAGGRGGEPGDFLGFADSLLAPFVDADVTKSCHWDRWVVLNDTTLNQLHAVGVDRLRTLREKLPGWVVVAVKTKKEEADRLMRRQMDMFVRQHGPNGVIILLSNDHGFGPDLAYARRCGCKAVSVRWQRERVATNGGDWVEDSKLTLMVDISLLWCTSGGSKQPLIYDRVYVPG